MKRIIETAILWRPRSEKGSYPPVFRSWTRMRFRATLLPALL